MSTRTLQRMHAYTHSSSSDTTYFQDSPEHSHFFLVKVLHSDNQWSIKPLRMALKALRCCLAELLLEKGLEISCLANSHAEYMHQQLPQRSVALIDRFTYTKVIGKLLLDYLSKNYHRVYCLKKSCCQVSSLPTPVSISSHSQVMKKTTDCRRNYSAHLFWSLHKEASQREFSGNSG